jgi:peptide/nickel transport system permease protein
VTQVETSPPHLPELPLDSTPSASPGPADVTGTPPTFFTRTKRYRDAGVVVPASILVLIVLACFFGPTVFSLPDATTGDLSEGLLPIGSPGHPLGTNALGNDMLAQLLVGGRVTLTVAFGAIAIGMIVGSLIGMLAAFYQRVLGPVLMRCLDVIFAFPDIVLAIAIASYLGPSMFNAIIAIGFFSIAGFGRITRAQTLRVVHMDYVVAARTSGVPMLQILTTHVWPNVAGRVFAYGLVAIAGAMMAEAALSFLGLGVPAPTPSWGSIIGQNQSYMTVAPQLIVMPAIMLFATIASVNLLSDALQEKRAS